MPVSSWSAATARIPGAEEGFLLCVSWFRCFRDSELSYTFLSDRWLHRQNICEKKISYNYFFPTL